MRLEEYLETLTSQIRCTLARDPIEEELRCHIEDQMEAYMAEGMSEAEAEEAAVQEMGDPVKTGEEFDRVHRPKMPWNMITLIILLGVLGFVLQYLVIGPAVMQQEASIDFHREFFFLLIGFAVMIGVCCIDYSRIISKATWIFYICYAIFLNYWNLFGTEINGSKRWISIEGAGLAFDVTQIAFLFVPLFAMMLCEIRGSGYFGVIITVLVMLTGPVLWMLKCPSVFCVIVLFVAVSFLLTLSVLKGWFRVSKKKILLAYWGIIFCAAAVLLVIAENGSYQMTRFHRFFGLGEGISYQMVLLREMTENAKWIGNSSFEGLTLSYSDYMLAHIIDRFGIAAGIAVVAVILLLILILYRKSFAQKNESGMLIGVSCATVFLAQLILYLFANLGFISISAYCPLLTYGGSGTLVTYILFGLLLCVFRYENVMALYRGKSPKEYREIKEKREADKGGRKGIRQYEEQIKLFLIVAVLFFILIKNG